MIRQFFTIFLPVKIKKVFKSPLVRALLVFFFFCTIFGYAQFAHEGLYGSDAYYHAKHSQIVYESGKFSVVKPWIAFHFFSTLPADPYVLHHFITGQVNRFLGPVNSLKLVSALQATLIFLFFYLIAWKKLKEHNFLLTLLFFLSSTIFSFRILLGRPFVISIALMIAGFYLLSKKRYVWAFFFSVLYILMYNFIAPFLLLSLLFSISIYYEKKIVDLRPIISVFGGVLLGLILHPQTIGYTHVILVHTFEIFYLKLAGITLPSGSELATMSFSTIMLGNIITVTLFLFFSSLALYLHSEKKLDGDSFVLLTFCSLSLVATVLVPRMVEYWVPMTFLLSVYVFVQASKYDVFKVINNQSKRRKNIPTLLILAILTFFCSKNLVIFYNNIAVGDLEKKKEFYEATDELSSIVSKGKTVFLTNWSSFAPLFFENSDIQYIAGFDPVFMYNYDQHLYWTWYNLILRGLYCPQREACMDLSTMHQINAVQHAVHNIFESDYIFSSKTSPLSENFRNFVSHRPNDFEIVFENDGYIIIRVK
ncbi:MAG: hypothetical protein ABII02_03560 [Candidatus Magasanikbacteria bacterium]